MYIIISVIFFIIAFFGFVIFREFVLYRFRTWIFYIFILVTLPILICILIIERISFRIILKTNPTKYLDIEEYNRLDSKISFVSNKIKHLKNQLSDWSDKKEKKESHNRGILSLYKLMGKGDELFIYFKGDLEKGKLKTEAKISKNNKLESHTISYELENIITEKLSNYLYFGSFEEDSNYYYEKKNIEGNGKIKRIDKKNYYFINITFYGRRTFKSNTTLFL